MGYTGTTSAMWLRSDRKQQLLEFCCVWLKMDSAARRSQTLVTGEKGV